MSKKPITFGCKSDYKSNDIINRATVCRGAYQDLSLMIVVQNGCGTAVYYAEPTPDNFKRLFDDFAVNSLEDLNGKEITAYWSGPCGAVTLLGFKPRKAGKKAKKTKKGKKQKHE